MQGKGPGKNARGPGRRRYSTRGFILGRLDLGIRHAASLATARAFGSRPNALACGVKISGAEVFEEKALLGKVSKANNYCHENVVVLSDSRARDSLLAAPKAVIFDREEH